MATVTTKKRAITADDLYAITMVSDPQASPNGAEIAYVVTTLDKEADGYQSSIAIVETAGGTPWMLTNATGRDSHPRWSPDGSLIAFVSTRAPQIPLEAATPTTGKAKHPPQVWVIPAYGGEAVQLTSQKNGATAPEWSPDGKRLCFVSMVDAADDKRRPKAVAPIADERVIEVMRYRHDGRGYVDGKYSHLFVISAEGGQATQLTFGDMDDRQPAWSPNGREIAFVSNRTRRRQINTISGIYRVPSTGGEVRPVVETDGIFEAPVWSPQGDKIAFSGFLGAEYGSNTRLWTIKPNGREMVCHTNYSFETYADRGMSDVHTGADDRVVWTRNGKSLLSLASCLGSTTVNRVSLTNRGTTTLAGEGHRITGFTVAGSKLVAVAGAIDRPFELFTAPVSGGTLTQLTRHNSDFLLEVALAPAEHFLYTPANEDLALQGWLMRPVGVSPTKRLPMIVLIHGGPHAMYGFSMFHEMQLMAARGYAVFFSNPRGSAGSGEWFATCTRANWGVADMPDIMAGVDAAIARGGIDPERIGVTGGSYGGYLTNWIVGHTDRFKAAVTERCVSNLHSMYGTSDIGFDFGEYEFGGTPWADPELLLKHSPIQYMDKVRTPLMILHYEGDLRCPIEQAEQVFTALKRLGRTTRFVRIPEEDHNLSRTGKPSRRIARLHHLIGWFDEHL